MGHDVAGRTHGLVRRDLVDHALARRALLQQVFGGGLFTTLSLDDVCDASPYLVRAAQAYGQQTDRTCPVCRRERLWEVAWVYGETIGAASGSARTPAQLARLAAERPDFSVHEVEVCTRCGWNHLLRSWTAGTPGAPRARRRRTDGPARPEERASHAGVDADTAPSPRPRGGR